MLHSTASSRHQEISAYGRGTCLYKIPPFCFSLHKDVRAATAANSQLWIPFPLLFLLPPPLLLAGLRRLRMLQLFQDPPGGKRHSWKLLTRHSHEEESHSQSCKIMGKEKEEHFHVSFLYLCTIINCIWPDLFLSCTSYPDPFLVFTEHLYPVWLASTLFLKYLYFRTALTLSLLNEQQYSCIPQKQL